MRTFGFSLMLGGLIAAICFCWFDISVHAVSATTSYNASMLREVTPTNEAYVLNVGLIADREIGILLSIGTTIVGAIFFCAGVLIAIMRDPEAPVIATWETRYMEDIEEFPPLAFFQKSWRDALRSAHPRAK